MSTGPDKLLENANARAKQVADIAARVAREVKSVDLGRLAAHLIFPDFHLAQKTKTLDESSHKILALLKCLCLHSRLSRTSRHWMVPPAVSASHHDLEVWLARSSPISKSELGETLASLARDLHDGDRNIDRAQRKKNLLQDLLNALEYRPKIPIPTALEEVHTSQPTDDYDSKLNDEVYHAITNYLASCRLPYSASDVTCLGHSIRLCLGPDSRTSDQDVLFKLLLSSPTRSNIKASSISPLLRWQQIGLIPHSKHNIRRLRFEDDSTWKTLDNTGPLLSRTADTVHSIISPQELCALLSDDQLGDILLMLQVRNKQLLRSDNHQEGNILDYSDSISLATVLEEYQLTIGTRLVLAYVIARSVWRFYNSNWMRTRWSSKSMHFVKERSPYSDNETVLYAQNLCFAMQSDPPPFEVCETFSGVVAHPYPRLLALCRLLVELGSQRPLASLDENHGISPQKQINDDAGRCARVLKDDAWPTFDTVNESIRNRYRQITKACFDRDMFRSPESVSTNQRMKPASNKSGTTVETRRLMLYTRVVAPLKKLMEDAGCGHGFDKMKELTRRIRASNEQEKSPSFLNRREGIWSHIQDRRSSSRIWILNAQQSYATIAKRYRPFLNNTSHKRTRIAVLDTGYDNQAVFFNETSRSKRMKGWRDYVCNSPQPIDDDGHGTRVVTLLMKLAPFADIYVARIAKDSAHLDGCDENIASAIQWASEQGCSIISMSFGFQKEAITVSNAINMCLTNNNGATLFFAAAGNDAGNSRQVMFPARHEYVIAIYGTNANGSWSEGLNPPKMYENATVFGTLAEEIPCSRRRIEGENEDEVYATGTSFATVVAAGLSGTILEYVALLEAKEKESGSSPTQWRTHLSRRRAMVEMLKTMADLRNDDWRYLNPIRFFGESEEVRRSYIIQAINNSP